MAANPKRNSRRGLGHRRRVEDEGEDEGGPETLDALDDDSITEGSVVSDENNHADDSDTSNVDEASPTSPVAKKTSGRGSGKAGDRRGPPAAGANDSNGQVTNAVTEVTAHLEDFSISEAPEVGPDNEAAVPTSKPVGPVVVSSTSVQSQEPPFERRRREHEEYRKKRDEDPAFVPNRGATLSTEKTLGNVEIRVFFPGLKEPKSFSGIPIKRYTKLPDHRPPLRRDKPVRISLPNNPPRYIFPAVDRSFIFIPRAMRPNQQRVRGKPRPGLGSVGGFSRRTSVYGGSYYNGSVYTPSVDMSRRSSIAPADFISPTGSAMSRPVVRLPPMVRPEIPIPIPTAMGAPLPPPVPTADITGAPAPASGSMQPPPVAGEPSINGLPQPQAHPLPQKPTFQENRPNSIPMHQPRPQKAVSLENIESPTRQANPPQQYQQAFHQQSELFMPHLSSPQLIRNLSLNLAITTSRTR
ncbi:hypothetical protein SLS53_005789 [Cytospora paraplurivora]|uniref:Btz domain-containing protein n=1 Tax=Cytospora paraplurivora TaxID=2898453 RepID=A0AAN9UCR4_9PEZI